MSTLRSLAKTLRKAGLGRQLIFLMAAGLLLLQLPGLAQEEEAGEFKGVGIDLRFRGGWAMFSGGDIKNGMQGLYDQTVADIVGMGYETVSSDEERLESGAEITGDIIYYFRPRLGIGLGGGWLWSRRDSAFRFRDPGALVNYLMTSSPKLDILCVRLGVFYTILLGRPLAVSLNAGPAWYFADFEYGKSVQIPVYVDTMTLQGEASSLGLEGGIGLHIRMNRRLDFVIEAQARYAKFSGFEGKQQVNRARYAEVAPGVWKIIEGSAFISDVDGTISFLEGDGFPRLDIFPGGPSPGLSVKDASLDLSGVSFQAGLNFKF